jgi:hypothetical protein
VKVIRASSVNLRPTGTHWSVGVQTIGRLKGIHSYGTVTRSAYMLCLPLGHGDEIGEYMCTCKFSATSRTCVHAQDPGLLKCSAASTGNYLRPQEGT